jgi:hypothetical protein
MSSNKKHKDDFEAVRQYLLDCPHVAHDSPAIQAALSGVDLELKRRERDAKLQKKFGVMVDAVKITADEAEAEVEAFSGATHKPVEDDVMADDWQDVATNDKDEEAAAAADGFIGNLLSKQVITSIAKFDARVKSPLGAIALALHAAMRSEALNFACTGVNESTSSSDTSGFAPPIRELSSAQFLPANWENESEIALRYRKNGTGAVILKVRRSQADKEINVEVNLCTPEPSETLVFGLSDYVNLDSMKRAFQENALVSPALHYKSLSNLLTRFASKFDLGVDDSAPNEPLPYVDTTIQMSLPTAHQRVITSWVEKNPPITTMEDAFPGTAPMARPYRVGEDDLLPGGMAPPYFMGQPSIGGSQVGPNHPLFQGVGSHNPGMQPRFDPIYPPGGPTDIFPGQLPRMPGQPPVGGRVPPGGTGNPNDTSLRQPGFHNNMGNMFM